MFKFLKKTTKPSSESQTAPPKYSEEELKKFKQELENLLQVKEEHLEDAQYFEKLGLLYAQVSQEEDAIKNLEKSLSIKLSMGTVIKS
ncbi:Uncharacterised protein [Streptococcus criceti]|uniref:Tetratricopeptide repeat protein n=1 Tax=Streptococcus criceti HS-6 TaxID=873449 RepID=G5JNN4_STRCG|nr:hypothetical protein STRCR_0190 [Streptococcus criceti HS-6]SUN41698.1 Uncharacterised protein [Streptococcus criceti]